VPGSNSFGELFSTSGAEALNSKDFQQGFRGGPRVGLIRHGDSGYDLELSYFQIDGWRSDRIVVPDDPEDCLVMRAPGRWLAPAETPGRLERLDSNKSRCYPSNGMGLCYKTL